MSGESGVDAPVAWPSVFTAEARVRKMQTKLHRWALADHGFRFYRGNAIPSPWPEALIGPTSTA
ncbi:hypothetical protein, partial [Nonomuraea turkmeniaca]|uniref:hypothetical protein n=1 Tax=Nonomuraea turkmeniaca TaxID=103838 RepID=UPI001B85E7F1